MLHWAGLQLKSNNHKQYYYLSKGRLLLANFGLTETKIRETYQLDQWKKQFACARNKKEQIKSVCKMIAQFECNYIFSKLNSYICQVKIQMSRSHIAHTYSVRKLTRSAKGVSPSKLKENTHGCTSIVIRTKAKERGTFVLSSLLINLKIISYPS